MTRENPVVDVDVIIPVYNGAPFVGEAIDSALTQEFAGSVTVWCIDDASTDDSLAVLATAAGSDTRVRVLRNERNRGVAAARNLGVRASSAEFIAFLDQDDCWFPGKLALQLATIAGDPALGYVTGLQAIQLMDGHSRPRWARPEWFERPQPGSIPSTLLVRRRVFLEVGPLDETMTHGGDDTDWFARARRRGIPYRMLEVPVTTRRIHSRNRSDAPGNEGDLLTAVRRHLTEPGAAP